MALAMEKRALAILLLFIFTSLQASIAAVYKVGDSAGWTIIGNVDYKQWAANKTFQVGDIILFEYNPQFHNVMQVTHPEYQTCNASAPITTHTTGNDSITISNHGHHFFLCGITGHCQAGQKVDINVIRSTLLAPTPSPLNNVPSSVVPAPSSNDATQLGLTMGFFFALLVCLILADVIRL